MIRSLLLATALVMTPASAVMAQPIPSLSLAELEAEIATDKHGKIAALAVGQHGEVVYRQRFDGKPKATPVDIRSAGKSLTALAVGMAIADGKLAGTDVRVWPYLGSSRDAPIDAITVKDLLGMSSALDCNDRERMSPGQEEKMYGKRIWRDFVLALPARNYARDARGEGSFSYCTAGVFLLGQVVEQAVGESFDQYMQRRLFDPLGIDGVVWKRSRSGEVQSGGQLTISDEALLRLGRLVLNRGVWEGEQIIPAEWIKEMLTPRHQLGEHVFYGHLWWATPIRSQRGFEGAWMMKGNGGNIVAVVPGMDAVLVVQATNYNKDMAERAAFTALTAMLESLPVPEHEPAIAE